MMQCHNYQSGSPSFADADALPTGNALLFYAIDAGGVRRGGALLPVVTDIMPRKV